MGGEKGGLVDGGMMVSGEKNVVQIGAEICPQWTYTLTLGGTPVDNVILRVKCPEVGSTALGRNNDGFCVKEEKK